MRSQDSVTLVITDDCVNVNLLLGLLLPKVPLDLAVC